MIEIKPKLQYQSDCPYCKAVLNPVNILWQGMHICVETKCAGCNAEIIEDLKVGHAVTHPCQVDLVKKQVFCQESAKDWLGEPLLKSLQEPQSEAIQISKEVLKQYKRVIILNCIDYLYGHCLLKLLNAQRHLENQFDCGVIVIVPNFLRWMVPEIVAEVWAVDIPLKRGRFYYPSLDKFIHEESRRFEEIHISPAYSHPTKFDITKFTGVPKHRFEQEEFNIIFIWREDRIWCNFLLFHILKKLKLVKVALLLQNWKIQRLFKLIHSRVPSAKFAIAGLNRKTAFPQWIEDSRVDKFDEETERKVCRLYSESRLVIGVHGSNLLLPSGHAGMTIDLMPEERWSNFTEDILYQETDPRLAAFRYRYLPLQTSIANLAHIASSMVVGYSRFNLNTLADKSL